MVVGFLHLLVGMLVGRFVIPVHNAFKPGSMEYTMRGKKLAEDFFCVLTLNLDFGLKNQTREHTVSVSVKKMDKILQLLLEKQACI